MAAEKGWVNEDGAAHYVDSNGSYVTNHFRIPIDEAVDAQWEIRYSHDMSEVKTYGIEKQDTEEGATE